MKPGAVALKRLTKMIKVQPDSSKKKNTERDREKDKIKRGLKQTKSEIKEEK